MSNPLSEQVGGTHYEDMAIRPVEFCEENGLNDCESAAIKYICRHRSKNGKQDIEKAIHYLQLLMEMEYPSNASQEAINLLERSKEIEEIQRARLVKPLGLHSQYADPCKTIYAPNGRPSIEENGERRYLQA